MVAQIAFTLGLAWLASDTVYDGLKRLVRFSKLISTGMELQLVEKGEFVHIDLRGLELDNFAWSGRDYAVGVIARMCHLALGEFLAPVEVHLERPLPVQPERWEYVLASRVEFGAQDNRIVWARSDIMEPLVTGDPGLARVNDEQTQAIRAFNDNLPYDEFVKRQLANDLISGSDPKDNAALGFLGLSPTYWKELQLPPEIIKDRCERMRRLGTCVGRSSP